MKSIIPVMLLICWAIFFGVDCSSPMPPDDNGDTDTTSHNFTWQTFTFGEHSSSVLRDVAIIDENNIWVVGEIYMNDENGEPDYHTYNAVHWDGERWELKRIPFTGSCSVVRYPLIRSVWAFAPNDIWFARGGSLVHYNGEEYYNDCRMNAFLTGSINKIWGISSNNLYIVGNEGNIAHYDGTWWRKLESGTRLPINDIWGAKNEQTGQWEILAVASNNVRNEGKRLLRIDGEVVTSLPDSGLAWSLSGIWFEPDASYFIAGDGLYQSTQLVDVWERDLNMPFLYKTSVRGNNSNDVMIAGAFQLLMHYNGISWHRYFETSEGSFINISIKGNTVAVVGGIRGRALIVVGIR